MQLFDERLQQMFAVFYPFDMKEKQCQKALARCSLDVDKQLLPVIDSSANPLPQ